MSWNERTSESSAGRLAAGAETRLEQVEEARERGERALVRLGLAEEAQHRLGADQADVQAIGALADDMMRVQELDAGDRLQLAASLVQQQLDVRERLEPGAETRLRLADALGDRADAAAIGGVEMKDPIGLREAHRAQDDRLRLVRPGSHAVTLETLAAGAVPRAPSGDADLVDRRAAALARLTAASVHLELVLHAS